MPVRRVLLAAVAILTLAACQPLLDDDSENARPAASPTNPVAPASPGAQSAPRAADDASLDELASSAAAAAAAAAGADRPLPGTVPPPWLGTRALPETADGFGEQRPTPRALRERRFTLPDTVAMLPGTGFASDIVTPAPAAVIARSTWMPGCPVAKADLAWVRLTFRGFDGERHTGELLLHRTVAADIVTVFRSLWDQRFPLEEMRVTRKDELDAPPTGDGNNTSAFVCRPSVGSTTFSQHAYGLALDVNEFQNPYSKGDLVLPELASSYLDRDWQRPGMLSPAAIAAFARIGWEWGGDWSSLTDRHHFSLHNR